MTGPDTACQFSTSAEPLASKSRNEPIPPRVAIVAQNAFEIGVDLAKRIEVREDRSAKPTLWYLDVGRLIGWEGAICISGHGRILDPRSKVDWRSIAMGRSELSVNSMTDNVTRLAAAMIRLARLPYLGNRTGHAGSRSNTTRTERASGYLTSIGMS